MAEISKFDIIVEELSALEKQIGGISKRNTEIVVKFDALEKANKHLINENSNLKIKVLELERRLESLLKERESLLNEHNLLNVKEKENLKVQIDGLINRINHHLRS